ncbi:hypothetical protein VR010_11025 [Actinomycetaceae bacterium L2_0104]
MGVFGVALLPDQVRANLLAGEAALAYENASMMNAADLSGQKEKPRIAEGFSWNPVDSGIQPGEGYFESKLSGVGAEGAVGSLGSQVLGATGAGAHLLLTNYRLAIVDSSSHGFRLSIPRQEIAGIEGAPRLGQFGRIQIVFRDGSVVRPMLGMLLPRAAKRFLRAWQTGQPQS